MTAPRKPIASKPNRYPLVLPMLLQLAPDAVEEFKFSPGRRWRADFALPTARILVEVDGGAYSGGRHTRGSGFIADMEKLNAAAVLGYRVLRFTPQQARSGAVYGIVASCLVHDGARMTPMESPAAPEESSATRPGHISAAAYRAQGGKRKGGR